MAKSTSVVVPPNSAARVTWSGGAVSMPGKPMIGAAMCAWGSMPPGTTIFPVASMTRPMSLVNVFGSATATIFSPWMATSQLPMPHGVTTCPPLITESSIASPSSPCRLCRRHGLDAGELPDALDQAWIRPHVLAFDLFDDFDKGLMGRGRDARFVTFLGHQTVDEIDLRASALQNVLTRGGAPLIGHAGEAFEHGGLDLFVGLPIPLSSRSHHIRLDPADRFEVEAVSLSHRNRFSGQLDRQLACLGAQGHVFAPHAGDCRHPIAHRIDHQLGPALSPQVGGRLGAIDRGQHTGQFFDAWRDPPMHLADAKDGIAWSPWLHRPR